jgi:Arc/MetJ-type ribon-helix-helix transcriptional regulator
MSKKDFSGALRKTVTNQKDVIDDRFAKADSVLLTMKLELPPAPKTSEAPSSASSSEKVIDVGPPLAPSKGDAMVIRDTFSMPPDDHKLIEQLRVRAAREGRNTNKSEVIRAGLRALDSLQSAQLVELLEGLERVKPGRK